MKTSIHAIMLPLVMVSAIVPTTTYAARHSRVVRGAHWNATDRNDQDAVSTQISGYTSKHLGLVLPSEQNMVSGNAEFGFFKRIQVAVTISHSNTGETYELYQALHGAINSNLANAGFPPDNAMTVTNWRNDAAHPSTTEETRMGFAAHDWSYYPSRADTIGGYPWQAPHTLYIWDSPGMNTLAHSAPGDMADSAPPADPGYWFFTYYADFEDIVKFQDDGVYKHVVHSTFGPWHRSLQVVTGTNAAYATHNQWMVAPNGHNY